MKNARSLATTKNDQPITLTRGDLLALIREAQGIPVGQIGPDITERPYRDIAHPDGTVVCVTPDKGGPLAINGEHPDDFFGVDDDGVASRNTGDLPADSGSELAARAEAAAERAERAAAVADSKVAALTSRSTGAPPAPATPAPEPTASAAKTGGDKK